MKNVLLKPRFRWTHLHSFYSELIKYPPENYKIEMPTVINKPNITKFRSSKYRNHFYKEIFYNLWGIPYSFSKYIESSIKYDNYDLIFASQHIIKTEQPWVVDLEFSNALAGYIDLSFCKNVISKRLHSNQCKAILPLSNWAKETLYNSLDCKGIKDKIKVLRYTVSPKNSAKIKKEKSLIRILFIGSMNPSNMLSYEFKGLYETLDAFIKLQKEYDNIELVIRSHISPEIKEKVKIYSNIKILEKPLSKKELEELYQTSDIFPHSGFEVLNLSVLEAMSYGLPVIATSIYSTPELIKHMKNGILIDLPNPDLFYTKAKTPNDHTKSFVQSMRKLRPYMTDKLFKTMKLLIEDSSLRNKIGLEARSTIENGEYSIKNRNKLLKEIFDYATNSN